MSVYTSIIEQDLLGFINNFGLGNLVSYEGIQDGIANSNYAVSTTQGEFVLTIFEALNFQQVSRFVQLLEKLGKCNSLYPVPQADKSAHCVGILRNKPAVICNRLPGKAITYASIKHCEQIGEQLGKLHCITREYKFDYPSDHNLASLTRLFAKVANHLAVIDHELIQDELAFQTQFDDHQLPAGFIHGDLFKDNVLMVDGEISGIIDFYSGGHDSLLRDVAIAVNDWCCEDGGLNSEKMHALLAGYQRFRTFEALEKHRWRAMLRMAALRFWLSRLIHQFYSSAGELTQHKNPLLFRQLLIQHREHVYV